MFRRRARTDDPGIGDPDDADIEVGDVDDARDADVEGTESGDSATADTGQARDGSDAGGSGRSVQSRPSPGAGGPWDSAELPPDDETPRIDLGGIAVPVPEGLEVRVEVQDDVVVAATLVDGPSVLQIHAFAAPRSSGLWHEVRTEISASLHSDNGNAEEADGPFGTELRARIPSDGGPAPARFLGVDGPRWFLRGLMTGPAATDPAQGRRLEEAFRGVVVNRGSEAMAPRDMLPLRLPREAMEAAASPEQPAEPAPRELLLPERGPEITEIQ